MDVTSWALIEKHTLIDRHGFTLLVLAGRTSDDGLEKDCGHNETLSNIPTSESWRLCFSLAKTEAPSTATKTK